MDKVPRFIISIRPEEKQETHEFCGRISLMNQEFKEIAYLEFSKSKRKASIYIDYISTDTEYRRRGLGRMTVSILENLARFLNVSRIYSYTISEEGAFLMGKMGYKKTKKDYYYKKFGRKKK